LPRPVGSLPVGVGFVFSRSAGLSRGGVLLRGGKPISALARAPLARLANAGESDVSEDLAAMVTGFIGTDAMALTEFALLIGGKLH
jgi:hypothetical protein